MRHVVWNLYPGISIPVARTAAPCLSQYCSNSFSILRVNKREKLVFVKANFGQYWISNNEIRYWLQTCHINIAAVNCNFSSPLLNTHLISFLLGGLDWHWENSEYAENNLSLKLSLGKKECVSSLVRLYTHMSRQWRIAVATIKLIVNIKQPQQKFMR